MPRLKRIAPESGQHPGIGVGVAHEHIGEQGAGDEAGEKLLDGEDVDLALQRGSAAASAEEHFADDEDSADQGDGDPKPDVPSDMPARDREEVGLGGAGDAGEQSRERHSGRTISATDLAAGHGLADFADLDQGFLKFHVSSLVQTTLYHKVSDVRRRQ